MSLNANMDAISLSRSLERPPPPPRVYSSAAVNFFHDRNPTRPNASAGTGGLLFSIIISARSHNPDGHFVNTSLPIYICIYNTHGVPRIIINPIILIIIK